MIKFGYLEGYNAINVPKYPSANARDRAFDDYTLYSIDAYYPPYYTNVIKVDISEVPQTTPINFVILVHNSKYYYYFTDKIRYINEDVYEIAINMDTVLTHMFDYKVTNGIVSRESIERWIITGEGTYDREINRNYVRENVSEGIMEQYSISYREPNTYLILTCTQPHGGAGVSPTPTNIVSKNGIIPLGYYVFIIPLPSKISHTLNGTEDIYVTSSLSPYTIRTSLTSLLSNILSNADTVNIMFTKSEFLDKVYNTSWEYVSSNRLDLHFDFDEVSYFMDYNYDVETGIRTGLLAHYVAYIRDSIKVIDDVEIAMAVNRSVNANFSPNFIPQLIDENYQYIEYGDVTGFTSYPMHQLKDNRLTLYNTTDYTTGNNGYYMNEKDTLPLYNKFNTFTFTVGTTLDLVTNYWKQYQAQNKGTLSTGLQLQVVNTLFSTAKNVTGAGLATSIAQSALETASKGKYKNIYEGQVISNEFREFTGIADGVMQGINILGNYAVNRENLEYTPDTVKGRSSFLSMYNSNYLEPFIKRYRVSDYENCARKLEEFGYRVNRVLSNERYMQDICNNRYYYNCINIKVKSYKLLSFIPNEIINDINTRLENGLRFVNMNSLSAQTLTISEMFRYDNVETTNL